MIDRGLVEPATAVDLFQQIEPQLFRYPAIDPASFRKRVDRHLGSHPGGFEPG